MGEACDSSWFSALHAEHSGHPYVLESSKTNENFLETRRQSLARITSLLHNTYRFEADLLPRHQTPAACKVPKSIWCFKNGNLKWRGSVCATELVSNGRFSDILQNHCLGIRLPWIESSLPKLYPTPLVAGVYRLLVWCSLLLCWQTRLNPL